MSELNTTELEDLGKRYQKLLMSQQTIILIVP